MNKTVYKDVWLAKGSVAHELWQHWQSEKKDRNAAQKKLDQHLKQLDLNNLELLKKI